MLLLTSRGDVYFSSYWIWADPVTAFTNRWIWCSGTSEPRTKRTSNFCFLFLGIFLLGTQFLCWEKPKPRGEIMWNTAKTLQLTALTEPTWTTSHVSEPSSNTQWLWSLMNRTQLTFYNLINPISNFSFLGKRYRSWGDLENISNPSLPGVGWEFILLLGLASNKPLSWAYAPIKLHPNGPNFLLDFETTSVHYSSHLFHSWILVLYSGVTWQHIMPWPSYKINHNFPQVRTRS